MDILSPTANPHGVYPDLKIYAGQETWPCARDLRIPFRVIRNKEKKIARELPHCLGKFAVFLNFLSKIISSSPPAVTT